MNRIFPGKKNGNYEEKRAFYLLKKLKDFDYVIDLHSSSEKCPLFGIVTNITKEKIDFAKNLGLKRLVIMDKEFARGNALIDFIKVGLSLEIGPHKDKNIINETQKVISNFIVGGKRTNPDIFKVINVIKQEFEDVQIENFKKVYRGEIISCSKKINQLAEFDFVPVLVREEAYRKQKILCLACEQVNLKELEF